MYTTSGHTPLTVSQNFHVYIHPLNQHLGPEKNNKKSDTANDHLWRRRSDKKFRLSHTHPVDPPMETAASLDATFLNRHEVIAPWLSTGMATCFFFTKIEVVTLGTRGVGKIHRKTHTHTGVCFLFFFGETKEDGIWGWLLGAFFGISRWGPG